MFKKYAISSIMRRFIKNFSTISALLTDLTKGTGTKKGENVKARARGSI